MQYIQPDQTFTHSLQVTPNPSLPQHSTEVSSQWNHWTVVWQFAWQTGTQIFIPLAAAVAMRVFFQAGIYPCLTYSGAFVGARLVIKAIEWYDPSFLDHARDRSYRLTNEIFPQLQLIGALFALALAALNPLAGAILTIPLAIVNSLLIEAQQSDNENLEVV